MTLLILKFENDFSIRLIGSLPARSNELKVLGIATPHVQTAGIQSVMIRELYDNADSAIRTDSLENFRINLEMAFRVALSGGGTDPLLRDWMNRIDVSIEETHGRWPAIKVGTSLRFYHPSRPQRSWIWKDTVRELEVILKTS